MFRWGIYFLFILSPHFFPKSTSGTDQILRVNLSGRVSPQVGNGCESGYLIRFKSLEWLLGPTNTAERNLVLGRVVGVEPNRVST